LISRLSRRSLLLATGLLPLVAAARIPDTGVEAWHRYRAVHITAQGRVVDGANGGISHSEGQGYALLFAAAFGDRITFDRIWLWTASQMRVRGDGLFAWKWDPADPARPVPDPNNASDGDLLIAWALARGADRWGDAALRREAAALAGDIAQRLVRVQGGLTCLLPGLDGFDKPEGLVVNPSYWVFPAFADLAAIAPSPVWRNLTRDGVALIERGVFGPWRLPPDWLLIEPSGALRPAPGFRPHFGFNAVRVPLHLAWAGLADTGRLSPFLTFWAQRPAPAWVDLQTGETAPYPISSGVLAIAEVARATAGQVSADPARLPALTDGLDYYAASLLLLSRLAFASRFSQ